MWEKTNLCILVCLYSIFGHYIDFFDFQTNRSLQRMKIELRLHRESCFHVELEVLLMELLAFRIYLTTEEKVQILWLWNLQLWWRTSITWKVLGPRYPKNKKIKKMRKKRNKSFRQTNVFQNEGRNDLVTMALTNAAENLINTKFVNITQKNTSTLLQQEKSTEEVKLCSRRGHLWLHLQQIFLWWWFDPYQLAVWYQISRFYFPNDTYLCMMV